MGTHYPDMDFDYYFMEKKRIDWGCDQKDTLCSVGEFLCPYDSRVDKVIIGHLDFFDILSCLLGERK